MEISIKKKTLKRPIWLILLIIVIVPWKNGFACDLPEPYVLIKCQMPQKYFQEEKVCLDDECNFFIVEEEELSSVSHVVMFNDKYLMVFNDNLLEAYEIPDFHIVNQLCSENIQPYIPTFEHYYEDWDNIHSSNRIGSRLIIEPYSEAREAKFEKIQNDHQSCYKVIFEHVGNWLVSVESIKDYCSTTRIPTCPYRETRISPVSLVVFLFRNIGPETYPLLLGFLLVLGISVSGFYILYRRKEIKYFFIPSGWTFWRVIGILAVYLFMIIFVPIPINKEIFTIKLLGIYLLIRFIIYANHRIKQPVNR